MQPMPDREKLHLIIIMQDYGCDEVAVWCIIIGVLTVSTYQYLKWFCT